jgi:hypothetical protein
MTKRSNNSKAKNKEVSNPVDIAEELISTLRRHEKKYLGQAKPNDVPTRLDVLDASIVSLMEIRKSFEKLGGFKSGNLPAHLRILFNELGAVRSGTSSRLFSARVESEPSNQVTPHNNMVRAFSVVLVDLLMDKDAGPGLKRQDACSKVAQALEGAGFASLRASTIQDWRKRAKSNQFETAFQSEYEIAKTELPKNATGKTPIQLLEEFPEHLRVRLFK